MKTINLRPEDCLPSGNPALDLGIGLIGCGNIAQNAHLPAYAKYGFRVAGAADVSGEALERVKERFGIPFTTTNVDELLERDDVDVIDLAVPARHRLPLVRKIVQARKPILSQKPFAMSLAEAEEMVRLCEDAGVALMVNQQARWAPTHRAAKILLDQGLIGHVYSVCHVRRGFQDVPGSWYVQLEDFNIVDHGIHYIDLTRYFTGKTPDVVKATTTMVPGQCAVSPMIYTITCEYGQETQLMATLHFNNIVTTPALHGHEWYLDGTEGSIVVRDSDVSVSLKENPDQKHVIKIRGAWFPDAFAGSMAEMMTALNEGREPQTSGRDNLDSVRIALAAVQSSMTNASVRLEDV